jgi:thioesterase domain-containing protein
MAADYLREIRMLQSEGPYFLGGFSFGGLVAFEMAQQLQKQGEDVALLILLDPTSPRDGVWAPPGSAKLASVSSRITRLRLRFRRHRSHLTQRRPQEQRTYLLRGVKSRMTEIERTLMMSACRLCLAVRGRVPFRLRMPYFFGVSREATQAYVPRAYVGRMIVLRTQASGRRFDWARLAIDGLEIHEVPGSHLDIIKGPQVQAWAERLKMHLDQAQAAVSGRFEH